MGKVYTFKEITGRDELEDYFRMRYEIYSSCANKVFLHENEARIDIDYYDIHSCHYSLICEENKVGYIRAVLPKNELINKEVLEVGKNFGLLDEKEYYQQNGKAPFPFLSYSGVPHCHWSFYEELLYKNEQLIEASRLILHHNLRSLRVSKYLIECILGVYILACTGLQENKLLSEIHRVS